MTNAIRFMGVGLALLLAACGAQQSQQCGKFAVGDGPAAEVCTQTRDGVAIAEGDIAVGEVGATRPRAALEYDVTRVQYFSWPKGIVPYVVTPTVVDPQRVTDAIAHIQAHTKVRFVKRTTQADYVVIQPGSGCWSWIGRIRGPQKLTLADSWNCPTGAVIHELGHALGLWHEHMRRDRDKFITIHWENIIPGQEYNFQPNLVMTRDVGAYDFASIMHYAYWGFSKNGQPTITKKDGSIQGFGQGNALSPGDIAAIHAINGL